MESPCAVVERFLAANSVLDVDGMFEEIGPDARWIFPAAPPGAPREVAGKETNRAFFESILPMWRQFRLTFTDVHALADDSTRVVAHYASTGTLVDGSPYANSYLSAGHGGGRQDRGVDRVLRRRAARPGHRSAPGGLAGTRVGRSP